MKYDKLVRDKIPEIIRHKGTEPVIHVANEEEYWLKLKEKLSEEIKEFNEAESPEEMADILEVIGAIMEFKGFKREDIEAIKDKKTEERGGFKGRIILDES
jgi:predicted house-cleaning noncanonical NTP pyrophosphatase (MazG superfamily)